MGGDRRMSEENKVSKAQQRAVHKYVKANYDRLDLTMPKGRKEELKAHAAAQGESVNAFINRAITEAIERDWTPPVFRTFLSKYGWFLIWKALRYKAFRFFVYG